jgi:transposase-like protein
MAYLKMGALVAVVAMVLLAGCQQPGQVVKSTPSVQCPYCHEELVTSRIVGLDFKRFVCPQCTKEYVPPEGYYDSETIVYNCPTCDSVVATCPSCMKKALPPAVTLPMREY